MNIQIMYHLVTIKAKSCSQVIRLEYGALLQLELDNCSKFSAHMIHSKDKDTNSVLSGNYKSLVVLPSDQIGI